MQLISNHPVLLIEAIVAVIASAMFLYATWL
jgi:hypothetical protein